MGMMNKVANRIKHDVDSASRLNMANLHHIGLLAKHWIIINKLCAPKPKFDFCHFIYRTRNMNFKFDFRKQFDDNNGGILATIEFACR